MHFQNPNWADNFFLSTFFVKDMLPTMVKKTMD